MYGGRGRIALVKRILRIAVRSAIQSGPMRIAGSANAQRVR
jgi:hypothetical protein